MVGALELSHKRIIKVEFKDSPKIPSSVRDSFPCVLGCSEGVRGNRSKNWGSIERGRRAYLQNYSPMSL
jgi:hypothetical protein